MSELPSTIADELTRILGDEHVQYSARALRELGVELRDGDAPAWWLHPGSAAEVAELVRLAGAHGIAIVPIGNVARAPRAESLRQRPCFFVDSRRMVHVLHLDETSLVAHVQAGLTAHAFEAILAPRGLSMGDYPPAAMNATGGGLLAVRTPGKSTARHGFFEDAVLGVSVVMADGHTVHTRVAPRRATGPDLARAVCGAEGTLGFITSVVMRIHRRPESRLLDAHALPSFETALSAVRIALREDATPAAVRVLAPAEAKAYLGADSVRRGEALLLVATAGPTDLAACDRDLIASAANAVGGRQLGPAPAEIWWRRRTGHEPDQPSTPALQVTATPSRLMPAYRAVLAAAEQHGASARAYASRFDIDGAVLFFTFCDADGEHPLDGDDLTALRAEAGAAARDAGSMLLGHTNPGVNPYFAELRKALDPHDIMNPAALRAGS